MFFYLGIIALIIVRGSNGQQPCSTAAGTQGTCVNIAQCTPLLDLLSRSDPSGSSERSIILKKSQCGLDGTTPKVCCPSGTQRPETPPRSVAIPDPPDVSNHPRLGLVNTQFCGPVTEPKIILGEKTLVSEFPWMALIGYKENGEGPDFQCGGSVITERYVLTAAHCVTGLRRGLELSGPVRLGEHDLDKEIDCDEDDGAPAYCADKYQDFSIESTHPHSDYESEGSANDIALLRLDRDADFRPLNVRPICLPIGSIATLKSPQAVVTGWGRTEFGRRSLDLLKVPLTIVANDDCAKIFAINRISIGHKQLCAGGNTKDSCAGDSGGPLQYPGVINGVPKYVQYGIVSFGTKKCGVQGYPGVYTRVVYYMDWILDNIKE